MIQWSTSFLHHQSSKNNTLLSKLLTIHWWRKRSFPHDHGRRGRGGRQRHYKSSLNLPSWPCTAFYNDLHVPWGINYYTINTCMDFDMNYSLISQFCWKDAVLFQAASCVREVWANNAARYPLPGIKIIWFLFLRPANYLTVHDFPAYTNEPLVNSM